MTSKSYRVHVHDHQDQGRWLAQADYDKRPAAEDLPASLPVLADPGRYEVRVNLVQDDEEQNLAGWLQGEPASPQAIRVKRDGRTQKTFDSGDPAKDSNDAFAWLLRHQGQSVQHATRYEGWEITEPAPATRYAHVSASAEKVQPYLPANYGVYARREDGSTVIGGTDNAGWTLDGYVLPRLGSGLIGGQEITAAEAKDAQLDSIAAEIAGSVAADARNSGDDPITWVTGNAFMPPLRSFPAAESVYQTDPDGEDFARLSDLVDTKLADAEVALECPDYDNALYAVDLNRFEYVDDPGDHETLQQDWQRKPLISQETLHEIERVSRIRQSDEAEAACCPECTTTEGS